MLIDTDMRTRREADGVIYITLKTNGMTGPEWIDELKRLKFFDEEYSNAGKILRSPEFNPLPAGTEINLAILPDTFCPEVDLSMENIHREAARRLWVKASAEAACLIRRDISQEEMELIKLCYIAVIHDPIENAFLESSWRSGGKLSSFGEKESPLTSRQWGRNRGYVFLVPENPM